MTPFSRMYGWDRGLPVDRHYLEGWLSEHSSDIRGRVLEVKDDDYSRRFGTPGETVVMDRDSTNPRAELIADLDVPGALPASAFDCVVLTQVLQYTTPDVALANVWGALRPGGVLLLSVPSLGRLDPHDGGSDKWRWTGRGLAAQLAGSGIPDATITVRGNALACLCAIMGLTVQDVSPEELALDDPIYPLVAFARCVKLSIPPPGRIL